MTSNIIGRDVQIKAGMREFVGQGGTVVAKEERGLYRIRLHRPVHVEHVGLVRDDLWERSGFRLMTRREAAILED